MANLPPRPSRTSEAFIGLLRATRRIGSTAAALITVLALAAVALIDLVTGTTLSFGFLYTSVTAFAAWCLRERAGLAVATTGIVLMAMINGFYSTSPLEGLGLATPAAIWNTVSRALVMYLVALVVGGLRYGLEVERWRAGTDGLTGALNRAAFLAAMAEKIGEAQRRAQALVLAYIDLDGFKKVNDRFGHSAGDDVLRGFATAAARTIRAEDLFGRIGGDEFVALMVVPTCAEGDGMAEMLHARLTSTLAATGYPVTCSMGAAVVEAAEVVDAEALIKLADAMMYDVKRQGKNALASGTIGGINGALATAFPFSDRDTAFEDLLVKIDAFERAA